jgi:hypothetical protein
MAGLTGSVARTPVEDPFKPQAWDPVMASRA